MSLESASIAVNRFGLGARPGELKAVGDDPRGWLLAQLEPEEALPAPLEVLPNTAQAAGEFLRFLESVGLIGRSGDLGKLDQKRGAEPTADDASKIGGPLQAGAAYASGSDSSGTTSIEQAYVKFFGEAFANATEARYRVAVTTQRPFFERLCRFWANHFTVSAAKPEVIALAPVFERDVVRPKVCGRFEDMLLASCRHPAMLTYLDNIFSIGPNSPLAQHPEFLPVYLRERMQGLNENLAREILELHTLGVRSGYTQADVTSLARILTGWLIYAPRKVPASGEVYHYVDSAHEPGSHMLLGRQYAQPGEAQGQAALRDLARHPATAQHIATKLARHFIADDPPAPAVQRVARAFRDSDGDLRATVTAIVEAPEAWTPRSVKFKPPEDYLVSTARALGGLPLKGRELVALLQRMGQRPYWAPGPDGWPDVEDAWIGADAIWKRVEWASALAAAHATTNVDPAVLADAALGPRVSVETVQAIRNAESPSQGLALLLVSPEFQRR